MRRLLAALILLAACRGENPPRDYQNAPPDMTNPPATKSETPAGHGMGQAPPEASTGGEGTSGQPVTPPLTATTATTTTDTPPVTGTR